MKSYRLYLFDLDGTIYRGDEAVPHAAEAVSELVERGAIIRYLTNNSAATPEEVNEKLGRLGVPCEPGWVLGTGMLAAEVCREREYGRVHLVGEPSLFAMFRQVGIDVDQEETVGAVVVGIDRSFDYNKLDRAARRVREGAHFIATNRDATYPLAGGVLQPGAGAIVAAVAAAAGVEPDVLGKPAPTMAFRAMQDAGVAPEETVMVGDRMETDVASGRAAGIDTFLVLTGVATELAPGQAGAADLRGLLG